MPNQGDKLSCAGRPCNRFGLLDGRIAALRAIFRRQLSRPEGMGGALSLLCLESLVRAWHRLCKHTPVVRSGSHQVELQHPVSCDKETRIIYSRHRRYRRLKGLNVVQRYCTRSRLHARAAPDHRARVIRLLWQGRDSRQSPAKNCTKHVGKVRRLSKPKRL